jgi:hypothetical protein
MQAGRMQDVLCIATWMAIHCYSSEVHGFNSWISAGGKERANHPVVDYWEGFPSFVGEAVE